MMIIFMISDCVYIGGMADCSAIRFGLAWLAHHDGDDDDVVVHVCYSIRPFTHRAAIAPSTSMRMCVYVFLHSTRQLNRILSFHCH